jgi:hypothetical protein
MSESVKCEHIEQYIRRNYDVTLSTVRDDDVLFEALSEKIVELNPETNGRQLAEDFNKQNEVEIIEEYAEIRFNEVVHEETMRIISYAQKNRWIEYRKREMIENGAKEDGRVLRL